MVSSDRLFARGRGSTQWCCWRRERVRVDDLKFGNVAGCDIPCVCSLPCSGEQDLLESESLTENDIGDFSYQNGGWGLE